MDKEARKGFLDETPELNEIQERLLKSFFGLDPDVKDVPTDITAFFNVPSGALKMRTLAETMQVGSEYIPESTFKQMFGDDLPTEVVVIPKETIRKPFKED